MRKILGKKNHMKVKAKKVHIKKLFRLDKWNQKKSILLKQKQMPKEKGRRQSKK